MASPKVPRKSELLDSAAILEGLLNQKEAPLGEAYLCWKMSLRWSEIVGPTIGEASRPYEISHGVLKIAVKSAGWIQQLHFSKREILETLNTKVPELKIIDVVFHVGRTKGTS